MARIVFDLDGTLVDSAPDLHALANALMREEGRPPITLDEARGFIGHGAPVFVERLCTARAVPRADRPRLLTAFLARYERAVHLTRPYAGVPQALNALVAAGHRLGLCTNKPLAATRALLCQLGLDGPFETVLGGDSLPLRKPDPAPLNAAFTALGTGPRLYVGDSEVDALTAHRAGVPFLLHTEGYRSQGVAELRPAAQFDAFADLPGLVAALLAPGAAEEACPAGAAPGI